MDRPAPRDDENTRPAPRRERTWRPKPSNTRAFDRFIYDTYGPEVAAEYGIRRRR